MAHELMAHGICCSGFITEEVVGPTGSRIGFDVVTVPGDERGVLARKEGLKKSLPKVGQYTVDVPSFERLAIPTLQSSEKEVVYIIDEVGRMELHSTPFKEAIERLLATPDSVVVGALTAPIYGHRVPFCDVIAETPGVNVHKLTAKTRCAMMPILREELRGLPLCRSSTGLGKSGENDTAPLSVPLQPGKAGSHLELYFKDLANLEDLIRDTYDKLVLRPC